MKYCRAIITKSLNATIILNAERIILSKHVLTLDHVIANLVKKGERGKGLCEHGKAKSELLLQC